MNPSQETTAQDSERRKLIVDFNRLVVIASLLVVAFAAYLDLDYIFPSVLGSLVTGLNLHWTRHSQSSLQTTSARTGGAGALARRWGNAWAKIPNP